MMRRNNPYGLPYELFVVDFREQTEWKWLIASAFFLGGLGSGLFLVSAHMDFPVGLALGLVVVLVGKNTAHLLYLGRPERFWRALANPAASWISRGFFATVAFAVFGDFYLALSSGWLPSVCRCISPRAKWRSFCLERRAPNWWAISWSSCWC
ncbi:MAG: hypothetical protein M1358_07870 [Chloroflexi bacterium]|nr:hypothetical protein [Chloroflexota bacterium]